MNTFKGISGFILSVTMPVLNMLGTTIQLIGGIAGLVLLFFSIKYKIIQIRKANKDDT